MANWPGTLHTFTPKIVGDTIVIGDVNAPHEEIIALETGLGAGTPVTSKGGLRLTIQGVGTSTDIGYSGEVAISAAAGTPVTLIPGGDWDVAKGMIIAGLISASDGQVQGGTSVVLNGESVVLFDDGTNSYTVTCNAGGDVTGVRTGGALTYDGIFRILWF